MDASVISESIPKIIEWYRDNRRDLPWRLSPTPYGVWISETMLQQTRIETVIGYYMRFMAELPDVAALASVEDDRLMKLWQGLGYYSRARNLKRAALILLEQYGGELPDTAEELCKLPGIGAYTAGAIASIAYGKPAPAVDGNVLRVLARLTAWEDDVMSTKTRREATAILEERYPIGAESGLLTEGLMELGEVLCLPNGEPRCAECPLRDLCRAHRAGEEERYPVRSPRKARRVEERTVFLLCSEGKYAIRRRPERGLLAGLWEFPNTGGTLSQKEALAWAEELDLKPLAVSPVGKSTHVFTHVEWHMTGYRIEAGAAPDRFVWRTPEEIRESYSVPTALRFYERKL